MRHPSIRLTCATAILLTTGLRSFTLAQIPAEVPPAIVTPDKVETRLRTLEFRDGAPSAETLTKRGVPGRRV
jgi:hypothetical protein